MKEVFFHFKNSLGGEWVGITFLDSFLYFDGRYWVKLLGRFDWILILKP